ncbi:hypothetical protein CapIbe_012238 [Capra ibex]
MARGKERRNVGGSRDLIKGRLLDWEFSDLQFQPCPQPPVVERETPSPSNRIGQPALTHHCAECLKTCFTRWLGLACVITFEWGLGVGRLPCRSCVVFSKGELRARELLCSGEKRRNSFSAATRKAVFSGADGQPHHLREVNLANDMQVLQDRVITENCQRTPSADVLNTSDYSN